MQTVIEQRLFSLPLKLSIRQVAAALGEKVNTAHAQISRGTFPVKINQIEGGQRYVMLTDLAKFLEDGVPQPQPELVKRAARNPSGINRDGKKRGRPSHASRALAKQQSEINQAK